MLRKGPGRLSSLDTIAEIGQDDIVWALQELNTRTRTQADILFELNDRLAVKGIEPISKSAFNRRAVREYVHTQGIIETNRVAAMLAPHMTAEKVDQTHIVLCEIAKTMTMRKFESAPDDLTSKDVMDLSRGLLATAQALKISSERKKLEKSLREQTTKVINETGKAIGLTAAQIAKIRRDVLGVKGSS